MHNGNEDQKVEAYLRTFSPLPPAPLPQHETRWRYFGIGTAAALVIAWLTLAKQFSSAPSSATEPQSITVGSANMLLANASSWKDVIDDTGFAFRAPSVHPVRKERSALEFLSQEDLSR